MAGELTVTIAAVDNVSQEGCVTPLDWPREHIVSNSELRREGSGQGSAEPRACGAEIKALIAGDSLTADADIFGWVAW